MKQQALKFGPAPGSERKTNTAKAFDYDRRNLESARLILADPTLDPESFAAVWAHAVLERLNKN